MKKVIHVCFISLITLTSCLGQKIPIDKISHYSLGYIVGATTTNLFKERVGKQKVILIGCGTSALVGIAKEVVFDNLLKRGNPETDDAAATILGGVTGSIVITIRF